MSNFKTCLIQDGRISNITDEETYAVLDGPSQSNYQNFVATSQSASSIVWNIQIPSENIVIDRNLHVYSEITFTLTLSSTTIDGLNATPAPDEVLVFDYGLTDCIQCFPLTSLCTTQSATINNATISQSTKDILPMLLRMYDRRKLNRYNSMTPSLPDCFYAQYANGVGCLNNVLAGYNNMTLDEDFAPRGAYPVTIQNVFHTYTVPATATTPATVNYDNFLLMPAGTTNNSWSIVITVKTTEPFIALSPFCNTNSNNVAGLVGINNLSMSFNIDSSYGRLFSTSLPYISAITLGATAQAMSTPTTATTYTTGTAINPFVNSQLLFNFLSLQPEQYKKISSKNCVPYMDYPRYLSSQQSTTTINAPVTTTSTTGVTTTTYSSATLTSQSLQLNQIPDLILITVRKPMSTQTWTDSSAFLTINSISISFNNTSGILSTCNPQQLYNISYRNGSAQSYYEFNGFANNNQTGATVDPATGSLTYSISSSTLGKGVSVGTTGSLLVLNPVLDFNLPSYLSSGSLGQYNLYFTINVTNQFSSAISNPEICVITVNSGIFTSQLGSSVINTGILTKEDVLKTKEQNPIMDHLDLKRFIGGNLSNMGMSNVLKLFKKHVRNNNDNTSGEEPMVNDAGSGFSGGSSRISRLKKYIK
jgi:hypothetical protein